MEISEQTRTDVWQGWWDAARLTRYYQAVRDLHQRRHAALVAAILLCGTGAMATLIASVPDWLQPVFGFAVAALSVWIAVSSYAVKAAMANTISIECQEIERELSNLMALVDDPNNPPESEIRDCLVDLDARMDKATARTGYVGMTNNDKLNNRMAIEASKVLEASYA